MISRDIVNSLLKIRDVLSRLFKNHSSKIFLTLSILYSLTVIYYTLSTSYKLKFVRKKKKKNSSLSSTSKTRNKRGKTSVNDRATSQRRNSRCNKSNAMKHDGKHYRLRISIPLRTAGDSVSRKSLAK